MALAARQETRNAAHSDASPVVSLREPGVLVGLWHNHALCRRCGRDAAQDHCAAGDRGWPRPCPPPAAVNPMRRTWRAVTALLLSRSSAATVCAPAPPNISSSPLKLDRTRGGRSAVRVPVTSQQLPPLPPPRPLPLPPPTPLPQPPPAPL